MTDMTAFERQVAGEMLGRAGSVRPVDDLAIFESVAAATSSQRWGFTMFSALKFVAAAAIVALFGGFLLTGILTTQQGDEVAPAAVTASPTTEASTAPPTEELLSGMVTEVVEPGVFRVFNDGVRNLVFQREPTDLGLSFPDIVAGDDDGIWVLGKDVFYRLGTRHASFDDVDGAMYWPDGTPDAVFDFEVTPEGTVWAAIETSHYPDEPAETGGSNLWSFGGEEWTVQRPTHYPSQGGPVEVTPEGTVWAVWMDDPLDPEQRVFGYLGAEGWQTVGEWFVNGDMHVSDSGEVWADGWVSNIFGPKVHRYADGAWQTYGEESVAGTAGSFDIGPDGTLWGPGGAGFIRFDGSEWATFTGPDWMPVRQTWGLVDDAWVPVPGDWDGPRLWGSYWGEPHVAPDGSLWVPERLGVWNDEQPVCDHDLDGVARFDGEAWSHHLRGGCVEAMDIAADGTVWLLAAESGATYPLLHLYVITPEAIAGTE
jgi:hypothetical protein